MIRHVFFLLIAMTGIVLAGYSLSAVQSNGWEAPEEADKLVNPYEGDVKATLKGKKTFEKLCWSCHGMDGTGDGPAAVNLDPKPANYTSEQVQSQSDGALYWKITNGRGTMISYENVLSDNQRWQLVNYIRELGEKEK